MRIYKCIALSICVLLYISGCSVVKTNTEKENDLEFNVVSGSEIPKELLEFIEENKSSKMKLTYTDQGLEYVIIGYGEQNTSGYSVEVLEFYETENTVVISTNLLGPSPQEEIVESSTFPYIVILIEETEKPIMFE